MVAIDHDVIFWIEFLVNAAWHIAHRDQFRAFNACRLKFPGLADIEQRELRSTFR